jgi:hypothetical protein
MTMTIRRLVHGTSTRIVMNCWSTATRMFPICTTVTSTIDG